MCRLFGFRSAVPSRAHRSLVIAENALSEQARHHPDGWGLAYFHAGEAYVIKSERGAADSESFRRASERLSSQTMVVHVRRATVGELSPFNVHPFRHGRWVYAHNGTLFGFDRLRPRLHAELPESLRHLVLGTTDTETYFFWLLARVAERGVDPLGAAPVDEERLAAALLDAHADLRAHARAEGLETPVANYILTNGRVFVAQRFGRDLFLSTQKRMCPEADTCPSPDRVCLEPTRPADGRLNHALVASERIGSDDVWEAVPDGRLLVVGEDMRLRMIALPGGPHLAGDCPGCRAPDPYAARYAAV